MTVSPDSFAQFWAVVSAFYEDTQELQEAFTQACQEPEKKTAIGRWCEQFVRDLYASKLGYAKTVLRNTPDLEDELHDTVATFDFSLRPRVTRPTLCLSHDIDYLQPTVQLMAKRVVSGRRVSFRGERNYLRIRADSIGD
ncbi:MAG: hypothetical protein R3C68_16715 [Myxococcota bacterium]